MAADSQSVASLWQVFKEARAVAVRERLALAYLPLVRAQTRQMTSRVPPTVKSEDLEGYGMIGLLEAIDRFDPDRGIPFEVFARLRIRGAMYDYLRTLDLLPRIARRNVHRVQAQVHALTRQLGRPPTDEELAAGIPTPRWWPEVGASGLAARVQLSCDQRTADQRAGADRAHGAPTAVGGSGGSDAVR